MRNFQFRIGWLDAVDFAGNPAKARGHLIFTPALSHQLHTNADSKKWLSIFPHTLFERIDHSWNLVEASSAIGECAHAGEHHAIGTANCIRIVRDNNWLFISAFARSPFESFRRRMQIAGPIVYDGNAHR